MPSGKDYLDLQFLQMRERILSLAADFDRIERADGGAALIESDSQIQQLRRAMKTVLDERVTRAEKVQMLFSDMTSPPTNLKSQI